jgi:ATP-dependent Clp protease ATP-binding subunit ClpA
MLCWFGLLQSWLAGCEEGANQGHQLFASSQLTTGHAAHWAERLTRRFIPAGPSGHGKSMLSSFMQPIMAAGGDSDYLFLDCAGINSPDMLLGMPGWYRGAGKRPKLAELLWNRRGKRCVVVLDEFEKMAGGAQEDLLRVFDEGECK